MIVHGHRDNTSLPDLHEELAVRAASFAVFKIVIEWGGRFPERLGCGKLLGSELLLKIKPKFDADRRGSQHRQDCEEPQPVAIGLDRIRGRVLARLRHGITPRPDLFVAPTLSSEGRGGMVGYRRLRTANVSGSSALAMTTTPCSVT